MARPVATDFLHNMRFHVELVLPSGGGNPGFLDPAVDRGVSATPAGFATCGVPSLAVAAVEYKEGTMVYKRKQPGIATVGGDIEMTRGVCRLDSSFWKWITNTAEGAGEYRYDVDIKHYGRERSLIPPAAGSTPVNNMMLQLTTPSRTYHLFEAFPVAHNPASALDANNGDISIMSLTMSYEHFTIEEGAS